MGPPAGSMVFGILGYEKTFYTFAIMTLLVAILASFVLPKELNLAKEETNDD